MATSLFGVLRRSFFFWFGGLGLVVGLPFLIIATAVFARDFRYEREGIHVQGVVLAKEASTTWNRSGGGRTTHYGVTYRFRTLEGQTLEATDEMNRGRWNGLAERGPIEIVYLPSAPNRNRPAGNPNRLLEIIFGTLGGLWTAVGAVALGTSLKTGWKEWRLRRVGVAGRGIVRDVEGTRVTVQNEQLFRVTYEYQDHLGHTHSGSVRLPASEARTWKPGDAGGVLFDPDSPAHSFWTGRPGA